MFLLIDCGAQLAYAAPFRIHPQKIQTVWFFYPVPVLAHLSYWRDPDFYELIAKELMLKKAPEALAAGQG